MNIKGSVRVTLLALNGKRPYVQNLTHRGAMQDFREYVDWLRTITTLNGMWRASGGAMPIVRFDGGGAVRFVSSAHQLDGCNPDQVLMDEFFR